MKQLPPRRDCDFAIELREGAKAPKLRRVIPMTDREKEELRKFLDKMLEGGLIKPSQSEYAAPCFFVKKKTGDLRMVVDWRDLNE